MNIREFENVFKTHYSNLCMAAMRVVDDSDAAEDIVQDLFMHLWNNRETITVQSNLSSYLFVAARNRAIRYIQKHRQNNIRQIDSTHERQIAGGNATDDEITNYELEIKIKEAIENLPPKCREVFILSRFENKKYKEIAEILDISIKTVENQMGKALRMLREYLEKNYSANMSLMILLNHLFYPGNRGNKDFLYLFR